MLALHPVPIEFIPSEMRLLLCTTPAGFPSPAQDDMEEPIDLGTWLVEHPAASYVMRVDGHSMSDAGINDGDLIVVSPRHGSDIYELASMFAYAAEESHRISRGPLHRFLVASVATLGRPDAVHDISTSEKRGQWDSTQHILDLNPRGRRQTKKYRAVVRVPVQVIPWLNACDGYFVGVKSVRSAWDSMARSLGLPKDGEGGMKLIRRSVAKLLRDRLPEPA